MFVNVTTEQFAEFCGRHLDLVSTPGPTREVFTIQDSQVAYRTKRGHCFIRMDFWVKMTGKKCSCVCGGRLEDGIERPGGGHARFDIVCNCCDQHNCPVHDNSPVAFSGESSATSYGMLAGGNRTTP